MTDKTEREIVAEAEEEFERRAATDDPAGFVPYGQPPRGRAQVYSVRIPADAWLRCGGSPRRAGSFRAC
jgi:hypothetical protein